MSGFAVILLPRLSETGDLQVGRGEARQTGFRARAASRCAFVADFAARTRGRTRKRGDGGGVVVRFHLHDDVRVFLVEAVCLTVVRVRIKPLDLCAFNHGGIVFIRHHRALWAGFVRVANHAEQRFGLLFAVQDEIGIEDFVAAVFRIGLREHHQLHVGWVAVQRAVVFKQIVHLVCRQGQPHAFVRRFQRGTPATQHVHRVERLVFVRGKQFFGGLEIGQHGFGHAVVQQRCPLCAFFIVQAA